MTTGPILGGGGRRERKNGAENGDGDEPHAPTLKRT